ncbi:hypothetical protein Tco_1450991, partial [Tanacetum coccineum]
GVGDQPDQAIKKQVVRDLSGVYAANGGDIEPTLDMLGQLEVVLIYADVETDDLDVRDRAYIYWQLLLTILGS